MSWTLEEILLATGGEVMRKGERSVFSEVVTDSNKVKRGMIFIALRGQRLDGHRFLGAAARRGAACLIVHKRMAGSRLRGATVIRVQDTLKALGDLAHFRRLAVAPKVLAITGSNGKTTTKEMVAAILERASIEGKPLQGRVLKTEGNLNNLIGLPLTLLRLQGREKAAVVELGTSFPGEIARLCRIAEPDVALITSVAPAHLTGLKSVAGVAREKGALFCGLRSRGVAVVNLDDPWVRRLGVKFKGEKITYGNRGEVRREGERYLGAGGTEFTLRAGQERRRIRLRLCGEHNLSNAVAAAAMAYGFGADLGAIRAGLEKVRPLAMRMAIESWRGIGIINDAYNANPLSMEAALKALAGIETDGEKIAVLGDMLELGGEARKRHLELGRRAARYGIERLYLLGKQAPQVEKGALRAGMNEEKVTVCRNHRQIARIVRRQARRGDWLLVKGSRGMKMEKVLAYLKQTGA